MGEVFAAFRDDPDLRVAILRTAGERFFCAGLDLKAAAGGDAVDGDYGVGGFGGLQELPDLNKPVIAAVHGMAVGGGFELALSCDLIYATATARFGLPEINAGTLADAATIKLPKRMPYHVAMELLLTGRWMERPRRRAGAWSTRCSPTTGPSGRVLGGRPAARGRAAAGLRRDQGDRARRRGVRFQEALDLVTRAAADRRRRSTAPRTARRASAPSPRSARRSGRAAERPRSGRELAGWVRPGDPSSPRPPMTST